MGNVGDVAEIALRGASGLSPLRPRIGRDVPRAFVPLLAHSAEAYRAAQRFLKAAERLQISADPYVVAAFRARADELDALAPRLSSDDEWHLLNEVHHYRESLDAPQTGTVAARGHITRAKPGTALWSGLRADAAGEIEREAGNRLRAAAHDVSSAATIARIAAIDRVESVIGTAEEGGWHGVYTYLAEHSAKIAAAQRRRARAARAFKGGRTGEAATELAEARASRGGYHSKVKGLLGEAYASHCEEWRILREAFETLARRRCQELNAAAAKLGSPVRWEVTTVKDTLRIDNLEAWDEAVLVVEVPRPGMGRLPRAELVTAAQYKVERQLSLLEQAAKDVWREQGKFSGHVTVSHAVERGRRNYTLLPTGGKHRPTRFLFNAEGGELSEAALATFTSGNITAHRGVLRASVDDFNGLADLLIASTAAVAGR